MKNWFKTHFLALLIIVNFVVVGYRLYSSQKSNRELSDFQKVEISRIVHIETTNLVAQIEKKIAMWVPEKSGDSNLGLPVVRDNSRNELVVGEVVGEYGLNCGVPFVRLESGQCLFAGDWIEQGPLLSIRRNFLVVPSGLVILRYPSVDGDAVLGDVYAKSNN